MRLGPVLVKTTAGHPDVVRLTALQRLELTERYGADVTSAGVDPDSPAILLRLNKQTVGCVALVITVDRAEITRMYVIREARGMGLSRLLLARIEETAVSKGIHTVRLTTGLEQPEAMALYSSSGYTRIPCYGKSAARDRCFEKRLPYLPRRA